MFRNNGFFSSKNKVFSWWWLGIKVGVVTGLIIWWWLDNQNKKMRREHTSRMPRGEAQAIPLPAEETQAAEITEVEGSESPTAAAAEPDDLRKIEGIGPKINTTLQQAGITTFAQLAALQPDAIKQVLLDAGIRIGYPDTWPEQAALAAKADWAALEELQSSLQGGRRVG